MPEFAKAVDSHEYALALTLTRLSTGRPLDRRLTKIERLALAVACCRPRWLLTIDSTLERGAFGNAFDALKKRYKRDRYRPLIYFGTFAVGNGGGVAMRICCCGTP